MKKFLLALLVATAISPAMAKDGPYKMANPLYRPAADKYIVGGEINYARSPKKNSVGQPKAENYAIEPSFVYGITNKLSVDGSIGYGRTKFKSGALKGSKRNNYGAEANLSYLLASADNFDFNANAGLFYQKFRNKIAGTNSGHRSGADIGLKVGKKVDNITPYFGVGFISPLWSSRGTGTGTETYINPGVYVDLTKQLALDVSYTSVTHQAATYQAVLDIYANSDIVFGVGAYFVHPESYTNEYGALVNVKFGF